MRKERREKGKKEREKKKRKDKKEKRKSPRRRGFVLVFIEFQGREATVARWTLQSKHCAFFLLFSLAAFFFFSAAFALLCSKKIQLIC